MFCIAICHYNLKLGAMYVKKGVKKEKSRKEMGGGIKKFILGSTILDIYFIDTTQSLYYNCPRTK